MANRRMNLSGTGKEILDRMCEHLEIDRPLGVKIALSKGIALSNGDLTLVFNDTKNKWTIPDNIIRDREYLLFKHLIMEEIKRSLNDEEINHFMLYFIEKGLRIILEEIESLSSMDNYRKTILQ
ncbi:hypothetical protein DOE78_11505 [Bacillus sp. Y1]|nr:hypothetical protein [Bacillus sp. Y1]AYA76013.1 hypothetical protein DOE78_11505 [Bacillus sp. Y1]